MDFEWQRSFWSVVRGGGLAIACLACVGCGSEDAAEPANGAATAAVAEADANHSATVAATPEESWDVYYLGGAKVGYGRSKVETVEAPGGAERHIESEVRLELSRFGQSMKLSVASTCREDPDGAVLGYASRLEQGPVPVESTGEVVDGEMQITMTTLGAEDTATIPWSDEIRGVRAIEDSLAAHPMQPGETRQLKTLEPVLNKIVDVELVAEKFEPVELLRGTFELLRIRMTAKSGGMQVINSVAWADRSGVLQKNEDQLIGVIAYRTDEKTALAEADGVVEFDLGFDTTVAIDPPLNAAHALDSVVYRVTLDDGDPAALFVSGATQSVESVDASTALVRVRSIRPGAAADATPLAEDAEPSDADLAANNFIQCDAAQIVELANDAAGEAGDASEVALALERYVHDLIDAKNFSQGFASALEVAESREGDCTEHAVLLAAMARARGLPARVAIGLVYIEPQDAFGYHMWTEVYLNDVWVPIDATLARGGIGAGHLKLAHTNLTGVSPYASFLPVARALGHLEITVEESAP